MPTRRRMNDARADRRVAAHGRLVRRSGERAWRTGAAGTLELMRAFVRVAETGAFAAVARETGQTQSTVSRQVAAQKPVRRRLSGWRPFDSLAGAEAFQEDRHVDASQSRRA